VLKAIALEGELSSLRWKNKKRGCFASIASFGRGGGLS